MNYEHKPIAEIEILMKDGEVITLFGDPTVDEEGEHTGHMEYIYTVEEAEKICEREGDIDSCPFFMMPDCDIQCDTSTGFLTFKKNDNILFMQRRDLIRNIKSAIDDIWIDVWEGLY